MKRGAGHPISDDEFNDLALALFGYQYGHNDAARRFWTTRGVAVFGTSHWSQIPPVPQAAFKSLTLTTFDPAAACCVFRTSGTTSGEIRGTHYFKSTELYEASAVASFSAHVLPDQVQLPMLVLAPHPQETRDSSLSAMAGFVERFLCGEHGASYWMTESQLNYQGVLHRLEQYIEINQPVLLFGTAFAFVHLLDYLAAHGRCLKLPPGSRVMETGGFKGKSRAIPRLDMLNLFHQHLGVGSRWVVNEYGMTELSSQLYLDTLSNPDAARPMWVTPPWLRVRVVDPLTLQDVPTGSSGLLALYDLANIGSVLAVLTADLGRLESDGRVDVLGRADALERRGCSWAVDAVLAKPDEVQVPLGSFGATHPTTFMDHHPVFSQIGLLRKSQIGLTEYPPMQIARLLGTLSEYWLDPSYSYRVEAISTLSETTGVHPSLLALGMNHSFSQWTARALMDLVVRRPQSSPMNRCIFPDVTLIIAASNVPTPVIFDIYSVLMLNCAALVKIPSSLARFARIFIDSLCELDPILGGNVELVSWAGGDSDLEAAVAARVDAVITNGSDKAVADLRTRVPVSTPFLARGSRSSVVILDCSALLGPELANWAQRVSTDVVLWDQRGCLSPSVVYVKPSDAISLEEVGYALNNALANWEERAPCGAQTAEVTAYTRAAWDSAIVAQLAGEPVRVLSNVVIDERCKTPKQLVGRRLWVVPLVDETGMIRPFSAEIGRISTVVLTAPVDSRETIVSLCARAGASRVCAPGAAQSPPSSWHHDGVDVQRELVRWIDIELER
ncbi:MAG: hypothetical protein HUU55_15925 [Myxococcales bacterium]|nr:hypothetical protein [Myxococcales bacterium]